jgi:hypothetical protein
MGRASMDSRPSGVNMLMRWPISLLLLAIAGCTQSGTRALTGGEYVVRLGEFLEVYLTTNAPAAEAAMIELLRLTQECERARTSHIEYDQQYAAIYSRMYLVQKKMSKTAEAQANHQKAIDYWQKFYTRSRSTLALRQIREQIETMNDGAAQPIWMINK